jgi:two-component system OmpR family sensor kinase
MTSSLQRRISLSLSLFILVAGLIAASASFVLALDDATESQDAQLDEVAAALSRQAFNQVPPEHLPKDAEEAETRFVIAPLGVAPGASDPGVNFILPVTLPDGLQTVRRKGIKWRVMVSHDSNGKRFAVAQTLEARDEDAISTALLVLIPLALLIPALLIAVRISLRRAFAPLALLAQEADRIDGSHLNALSASDIPSEMQPFVHAVNRLLKRLSVAFEQQRRLISDAAHELRSPVAALTVQAENVRSVNMSPDDQARIAALHRGLGRISQLIEQLLGFARVQGAPERQQTQISLDEIVRSAIESVLPLATSKTIDLGCTHLESVDIIGTQQDAYALVRNAIDNAVRYTPANGAVDVSLERTGRIACLVVEDTGPGIDPADLDRVFDPFVRILGNRESGSGLGLSIASGAASAMGGTIELNNREAPTGGLRFTYRQAAV